METVELTADEARRIQLRAQGFLGADGRRGGVPGMLSRLGAVQLDTISVLARSHELVAYARLGPVPRAAVEKAYWQQSATFEYWAHAASILPVEEWPYFAFRRRHFRARGLRWHEVPEQACREVMARLRSDGPLTTGDLGGAKKGGEWWDWSDVKIAVEWLLDLGEVVCTSRTGWRRVYDLPERVIPSSLLDQDASDSECLTRLVAKAGRCLGVATRADLADYFRLKREQVDAVVADSGLVPVHVSSWLSSNGSGRTTSSSPSGRTTLGAGRSPTAPRSGRTTSASEPDLSISTSATERSGPPAPAPNAWADPEALAALPLRGRHRTTLLSPFDSLVWDRKRAARVFGFDHRLEAYVPRDKRVHGYFAMPLLAAGRLIGRVDPAREGNTLVARQVSFEPSEISTPARVEGSVEALATALKEAASWVGCTDIRVEQLTSPDLRTLIEKSL